MTLFAPDDLPLDDLLKLENRLRELSASLPPRRAGALDDDQSANDVKQLSPREVNLAPSLPTERQQDAASEPESAVTERLLSELEEFAARFRPEGIETHGYQIVARNCPDRPDLSPILGFAVVRAQLSAVTAASLPVANRH